MRRVEFATRGFTLLEVLVALLLLALALTALMRLASLEARASVQLREATFAQWVAANALAETRLREPFPPLGRREGESTLGRRSWAWRIDVAATDDPDIRRLEARVFDPEAGDEAALATLTGFASP